MSMRFEPKETHVAVYIQGKIQYYQIPGKYKLQYKDAI